MSFPERNHMFSTRYVLIWPKGRSVICGKAAGGSHLNSLPENEEMCCRYLEPMVKSGRTISHVFSFFVKKNRTVCFFGLWGSKNLSAGDFQELHLTGRALRSLESHKVLLCTQQVVSIEAGSVGPCFYFGSWSGCWLFLRECFLLTFLCRRWSFRSYLSRIRFGHWGDFCPFSACMFTCWRQRFFGNDQVLHLNLSFFHLTALLLSYHSMNRITLLAERAGMVIRLMQLWVPQRGCLLGTMGRNRGFGLKVGSCWQFLKVSSCWQFLFLRYNSNLPPGLSLALPENF